MEAMQCLGGNGYINGKLRDSLIIFILTLFQITQPVATYETLGFTLSVLERKKSEGC